MGQKMANRGLTEARVAQDETVRAEVAAGRRVEIDQPLLQSCMTAMAVIVLVMDRSEDGALRHRRAGRQVGMTVQ